MRDLKIFTNNIEEKALNQINLLLEQEAFKDCKVRIMPDVHAGSGCVIGFTANLGNKVIPNVVGVDIGCGMTWVKLKGAVVLEELDKVIRENIPSGMKVRGKDIIHTDINLKDLYCYKDLKNKDNYLERSMGTLGGGNHFIELDVDDDGNYYLVVHSGSRNLGKQVCETYQEKAIEYHSPDKRKKEEKDIAIKKLSKCGKQYLIQQVLRDIENKYKGEMMPKELCYVEFEDREKYLHDMRLCQKWASMNRFNIIDTILKKLGMTYSEYHETIHNYISDDNIVRKGAISAQKGEIVLIPMNMRDGCIIAKGKGNDDWNCSAPHGAGRIMSRMKAKETLKLKDYQKEMKGIFSTSICSGTIDEAPMVYKPMEEIVKNFADTVEIVKIIKPIYNFKAIE